MYNIFQVFEDTAELAEAWLASKEAFLTNEDLGVSKKFSYLVFCKYETLLSPGCLQSQPLNRCVCYGHWC